MNTIITDFCFIDCHNLSKITYIIFSQQFPRRLNYLDLIGIIEIFDDNLIIIDKIIRDIKK